MIRTDTALPTLQYFPDEDERQVAPFLHMLPNQPLPRFIEYHADALRHAARGGPDAAFALSSAMDAIIRRVRAHYDHPTDEQRDALLRAILEVKASVKQSKRFGPPYLAKQGLDALMGLVFYWAETRDKRDRRGSHGRYSEQIAYASILRDICSTISTLQDLNARNGRNTKRIAAVSTHIKHIARKAA